MQLLGSLLFTVFLFLWTAAYAIFFAVASSLLPFHGRAVLSRVWARVLLWTLRMTCRLDYRVEGREHLPVAPQVALIKHSSSWETMAQMLLLPDQVWVLKRELVWVPILGWCIKLMRSVPIDRKAGGAAVRKVVEIGRERLKQGLWVVIFPEGTRMPPGETRRYGVSGALLAVEAERLIVPIAHNAGYFWPRRGLRKKPGIITVRIGPPIVAKDRDPREVNAEAQAWIEANSRAPV